MHQESTVGQVTMLNVFVYVSLCDSHSSSVIRGSLNAED